VAGSKQRKSYIQSVIGHSAVTTRFQDNRTVMQEKFVPPQTSMATYFMTKVISFPAVTVCLQGRAVKEMTLPYLTLPLGWAGYYTCTALRLYQFGPMRSPDVTRRSQ